MAPDTTTTLLREAADALETNSVAIHLAVHGTRTRWGACRKDSCEADRDLVVGLRQLALIRSHNPAAE